MTKSQNERVLGHCVSKVSERLPHPTPTKALDPPSSSAAQEQGAQKPHGCLLVKRMRERSRTATLCLLIAERTTKPRRKAEHLGTTHKPADFFSCFTQPAPLCCAVVSLARSNTIHLPPGSGDPLRFSLDNAAVMYWL
jgi:hypothetical protein